MARLHRIDPYDPGGHTRRRHGRGFRYLDAAGSPLAKEERARAERLAIPPAWTEVWIADRADAHIQAVGVDAAGRRQYIYHPQWRLAQDEQKFERARALAAALPAARGRVTRDLSAEGLGRSRVLAASFRLLDLIAVRVGAEEYFVTNGSFGLSTLLVRHVRLDGETLSFRFPAKSGQRMSTAVTDPALAGVSAALLERTPRSRYLAWREGDGPLHVLRAGHINEYVREATRGEFTAKDFRTLHGTIAAASALAQAGPPATEGEAKRALREAYAAAAAALGNTPAVAKGSYVDPVVVERFLAGRTMSLTGTAENALLALLADGSSP